MLIISKVPKPRLAWTQAQFPLSIFCAFILQQLYVPVLYTFIYTSMIYIVVTSSVGAKLHAICVF